MFGLSGGRVDTFLGPGAEFRGNIVVEGRVDGHITAGGRITLGAGGAVKGNLTAPDIIIGGKVHGHVIAVGRAQLLATAHVDGDIKSPRLNVAEGATFSGKVGMAGSVQAAADGFESRAKRA